MKDGSRYKAENLPICKCNESPFCDPHHKHIVTGDLRIIDNRKLRKLLSKGPNYRENKFINFTKCKNAVEIALIEAIINLKERYKLPENSLVLWKETIMKIVRNKKDEVIAQCEPQQVKPILKDEIVASYLNEMHSKFVLVPIDKASNNIAIICKRFYIEKLLLEIGLLKNPSETYKLSSRNADDVIKMNIDLCKSFKLNISDINHSLPFTCWMPKIHYNPCRARFIVASAVCSTKPLSKLMSTIFNKIFEQIRNFHTKCQFYKNYNRFWVIQNSKSLLVKLEQLNS